jgi:hypothetical protein
MDMCTLKVGRGATQRHSRSHQGEKHETTDPFLLLTERLLWGRDWVKTKLN